MKFDASDMKQKKVQMPFQGTWRKSIPSANDFHSVDPNTVGSMGNKAWGQS